MSNKISMLQIVLLIFVLIAVPSLLAYFDSTNKAWRERTETETTQATVTSIDMSNHNTANYRYNVAGNVYQTGQAGWGNRVTVGQSIVLHYNPNNPSQHTLGDFVHMPLGALVFGFVALDLMIFWCLFLVYRARNRFSTSKNH